MEAQKIDLEFINYLGEAGVPFCIIFTKADKIGKVKAQQNVAAYKKKVLANGWEEMPQHFITSSSDGTGKENLLAFIDQINEGIFKEKGFI